MATKLIFPKCADCASFPSDVYPECYVCIHEKVEQEIREYRMTRHFYWITRLQRVLKGLDL